MAKTAFVLLLFVASWTALTAFVVITAVRSPPMPSHEPLWEGIKSHLVGILLPPVVVVVVAGLLACLSMWDDATPSGPSDLDRLLQVKRAGLWRMRYRMVKEANAGQASTAWRGPSMSATTAQRQTPEGSALDRLVEVKRQRGWYPMAGVLKSRSLVANQVIDLEIAEASYRNNSPTGSPSQMNRNCPWMS